MPAVRPKRSRPAVAPADGVPMRDMSAAAIASNKAQLQALERILTEVTKIRTLVVASLVFAAIAALVGIVALVRGESLEQRVRHLEEIIIRKESP